MEYEDFTIHNPLLRKRAAANSTQALPSFGAAGNLALTDGLSAPVATMVGMFEGGNSENGLNNTPQKNANKKKMRVSGEESEEDNTNAGSAASFEEDRRDH
jgi:hypothetical protein